jgi:ABC-type transport system involved in multi-copper enzyme maturation permease subunit
MLWLTWRQFRTQAVIAVGTLAVFAVLLAVTGPQLSSLYATSGIAGCHGDGCGQLANNFLRLVGAGIDPVVDVLGIVGIALAPAVIGIFWGAPLIAREFETGTFRMTWVQSVTRTRWLAVKLALPGLVAMAVAEVLSLMQSWWAAPISHAARLATNSNFPLGMGPFSLLAFDAHGITPLGYAAFAFTLGAATGVLLRRTVPAMAVTLAVFAVVQVAVPLGIRPHVFPPDHTTATLGSFNNLNTAMSPTTFGFTVEHLPSQPGAWILSSGAVNAAGQPVSTIPAACRQAALTGSEGWLSCMTSQGIRVAVTYQPASRYWPLQLTETATYLALALALAASCFWRLGRRRLS